MILTASATNALLTIRVDRAGRDHRCIDCGSEIVIDFARGAFCVCRHFGPWQGPLRPGEERPR